MDRTGLHSLKVWLNKANRKPLVLRGARQVGKSTLVRMFAEKEKLDLIEVNLERYLYLDEVFKTFDVDKVLKELQAIALKKLTKNSLLFLDEIQAVPNALACLRYFKEELPELPVIAAGSLLEFTLSNHSFSMPVGRIEYGHLGPMTFKEYLGAVSPQLSNFLEELTLNQPLPDHTHAQLIEKQREYLFTGGMPEAIKVFVDSGSLKDVQEVHQSICDTYMDDFSKYARKKDLVLLQRTFRSIPRMIGAKVKYKNISVDDKAADVRNSLELLMKARICHGVFASKCSGLPLQAGINTKIFKPLFLDIGLVNHLLGLDWLAISRLSGNELVTEGALAEQFIGQHLLTSADMKKTPVLNYWVREEKNSNAEVDYVISQGNLIVPVEVKAGKSGSLKSLQQFVYQKSPLLTVRFDMNPPSRQSVKSKIRTKDGIKEVHFSLISLPLYAVEELERIIESIR